MIYLASIGIVLGIILIDQITKALCVYNNVNTVIIPELLKFKLSYNDGASFSFLSGVSWAQTFFKIITIVIVLAIIGYVLYYFIKKKEMNKLQLISLALIVGGAIGNLIDRLIMNMVRDFIFVFYNTNIFPAIFNVADMALVIGVILLCVYILFIEGKSASKKENVEQLDTEIKE